MRKYSVLILLLLILAISSRQFYLNNTTREDNLKFRYSYSMASKKNILEVKNNIQLPIVNITLVNGTVYNFSTIDDAVRFLYFNLLNGSLVLDDIKNITLVNITIYNKAVRSEVNITKKDLIPSYAAFFIRKGPIGNYSGLYIPTGEKEAFANEDSDQITTLLELEWPIIESLVLQSMTDIQKLQRDKIAVVQVENANLSQKLN